MSKKISMDINDESFFELENWKKERRKSYGNIVDSMLRILRKDSDIKEELIFFTQNRLRTLYKELRLSNEFGKQKIYDKMQQYVDFWAFWECDDTITLGAILSEISEKELKRIKLIDGTLTYPVDFVLLNENEAEESHFVIVVEVGNTSFSVPHFVYFSGKSTRDCTSDDFSHICQLCTQKWPKFQSIIDTAKKPIWSKDYTQCLNESEVRIAPQIGYFDIKAKNDLNYSKLYKPPMGVQIVRDK